MAGTNGIHLVFDGGALHLLGGRVNQRYTAASGKAGKLEPIPLGTEYWLHPGELHKIDFMTDLRWKKVDRLSLRVVAGEATQ